ncbi:acyl-CoA carboxylase epsilon subunit [Streptacidiphilus cavernicola]|uniref:Acyl-CoA carboxylase epsilon subunit n=1 Tax=Streptacidiphilus cavernicola TaxID=3342716 RepID=A0ABV6W5Q1_9ACTN
MATVVEPVTAPAADPLVRVVKGALADEELAALTAVLLARAAAHPGGSAKSRDAKAQARWQRPERRPDYRSPVSWHS